MVAATGDLGPRGLRLDLSALWQVPGHSRVCAKRHAGTGFTVVELLLALAIAAILVAIAVPTYQSYRLKVQDGQAEVAITKIEARITLYYQAHDELPTSLSQVGDGSLLDPWGHPYYYLDFTGLKNRGQVRKDRNLVPLNGDYDLFSAGPNGEWKPPITAPVSQDDIIRADNGAYVGLASNY